MRAEDSRNRMRTIDMKRVPAHGSSPPCDWCDGTSVWVAFDCGMLVGASCQRHYEDLRRSAVMSGGVSGPEWRSEA
jgi:hypothetical protein